MRYITVKEASEKWNISTRRVCILCKSARIPGAVKKSKVWMIPSDAKKPEDARVYDSHYEINPFVLLLNPDYALNNGHLELPKKENSICEIQRKFFSGQLEEAFFGVSVLLDVEKDDTFAFFLHILKMMIAADLGQKDDYLNSKKEIFLLKEKVVKYKTDRQLMDYFWQCTDRIDSELIDDEDNAEIMPLISLVSAKRGLNEIIQNGYQAYVTNLELMCKEIEGKDLPLISAYYHIFLAVYLNAMGESSSYNYHIRKAADILLPRGWYVPLAEYSSTIDLGFIKDIDSKAYKSIEVLSKRIICNYEKVGIFDSIVCTPSLNTDTNIQIGIKIVQGKSNEEIANELGISLYKVKQHIGDLGNIVGSNSKKDIKNFVLRNFVL